MPSAVTSRFPPTPRLRRGHEFKGRAGALAKAACGASSIPEAALPEPMRRGVLDRSGKPGDDQEDCLKSAKKMCSPTHAASASAELVVAAKVCLDGRVHGWTPAPVPVFGTFGLRAEMTVWVAW